MKDYTFVNDIFQGRGVKIGASEVPALFPNPEKPTESVLGFGRTAYTVWQEKVGEKEPDKAGLAAEMGHYLEPKAIELFIREVWGADVARAWLTKRMDFEMKGGDPAKMQAYPILSMTSFSDEISIVHPDGLHIGESMGKLVKTPWGFKVDTRKDFLIEAKSASFYSAKRGDSEVKGYDRDDRSSNGIPLKHLFQIQFQMMKTGIDLAYLVLISDTSKFDVWKVKADRRLQRSIEKVTRLFMDHVKRRTPPKELAINIDDIKALYPTLVNDFLLIGDDDEERIKKLSTDMKYAASQEKLWKDRKADCSDALAVALAEFKELRDSEGGVIAKWTSRKGYEDIVSFKEMVKTNPEAVRYLRRKGLVRMSHETRYVTAVYDAAKVKKEKKDGEA